jgi:hypothetical protein
MVGILAALKDSSSINAFRLLVTPEITGEHVSESHDSCSYSIIGGVHGVLNILSYLFILESTISAKQGDAVTPSIFNHYSIWICDALLSLFDTWYYRQRIGDNISVVIFMDFVVDHATQSSASAGFNDIIDQKVHTLMVHFCRALVSQLRHPIPGDESDPRSLSTLSRAIIHLSRASLKHMSISSLIKAQILGPLTSLTTHSITMSTGTDIWVSSQDTELGFFCLVILIWPTAFC